MCILKKISGILKSNVVRESGTNLLSDSIGVFMLDPTAALSLTHNLKSLPSAIRDGIFFECLETYILNSYMFNEETESFEAVNLQSLAEASPNDEAGYEGKPDKMREYAKRLVKLIDDCGTRQKAFYLACVTRALLSKRIDTQKFFQLSRCVRNLTEEDLHFLSEAVKPGNVSRNEEYIEDYRALGLLYETDDGFSYTKRAFELKKYALCYEANVQIPNTFPARFTPIIAKPIAEKEILQLTRDGQEIHTGPVWEDTM